jgi:hypothetical protein
MPAGYSTKVGTLLYWALLFADPVLGRNSRYLLRGEEVYITTSGMRTTTGADPVVSDSASLLSTGERPAERPARVRHP